MWVLDGLTQFDGHDVLDLTHRVFVLERLWFVFINQSREILRSQRRLIYNPEEPGDMSSTSRSHTPSLANTCTTLLAVRRTHFSLWSGDRDVLPLGDLAVVVFAIGDVATTSPMHRQGLAGRRPPQEATGEDHAVVITSAARWKPPPKERNTSPSNCLPITCPSPLTWVSTSLMCVILTRWAFDD